MTSAPSFDPTVLAMTKEGVRLLATGCPACGAVALPARSECPRCGRPTTTTEVPRHGEVTAVAVSTLPLPGAPPPVTVVEVRLLPELVVQGVAREPVEVGDTVALVGRPVPAGDGAVTTFGFIREKADG